MAYEQITEVSLPGQPGGAGLGDLGRVAPSDMIRQFRERALVQLKLAQEVLAASDDEFRVETFRGQYARKNWTILQCGRDTP